MMKLKHDSRLLSVHVVGLGLAGVLLVLGLATGCARVQPSPTSPDLAQTMREGTRVACVGDFVVFRAQDAGMAVSLDDSLCQGREYLNAVAKQLRRKGYSPMNAGIVDVNWLFADGKAVPLVKGSTLTVSRMRAIPIFAWGDWVKFDTEITPEQAITPLKFEGGSQDPGSASRLVLAAIREIEPLLATSEGWKAELPAVKSLTVSFKEHDFVLLVWGYAHAVTNWQAIKSINWGSVVLQAAITAGATGGMAAGAVARAKVCATTMKAALVDVSNGRLLWFNRGYIDKHGDYHGFLDRACTPFSRKERFAAKLLEHLPSPVSDP